MPVVFIGIGSNIGDRARNCADALKALDRSGVRIIKSSSLLETKPWGVSDQPDFINMVAEAETDLSPSDLLGVLQGIELVMGRTRDLKWGPRTIDLDIIFYDDQVIDTEKLTVPHPLMHERDFVLVPLCEIAPQKVHPILKKSAAELLREMIPR
ncbi:MAG: 2-amino-4-hydroxy-6-hydroxymethyldihydropteridine diphosphokinase [Nitrospirae bacterium]|nr:2-amino-4-hydroxy-6-hydroxymethyldihydropteridine diphosphokinase [Nitrospirota bacterium]